MNGIFYKLFESKRYKVDFVIQDKFANEITLFSYVAAKTKAQADRKFSDTIGKEFGAYVLLGISEG